MTREDPQMKLRLPAELKDQLAALAEANGRSLNAEVVVRLEESLGGAGDAQTPTHVDEHTLDLFAEKVGEVVGQMLDERERKRKRP
ncbi:Arc family DNA-binding protein [Paraburkholderia sediminicola]|uniref:Arc family DNA-binding protein n=1 Tax=Paraburkholderia sediminicola TaxID=458836 RepID=UPI0038B99088